MIKIENLNFKYEDEIIFKNAEIQIPSGLITVILGPNGVGKTTLLKIITKNLRLPSARPLSVTEIATGADYKVQNCNIQNDFKKIFYIPQNASFPSDISTFDYLSTVFFKSGWKWFLNNDEKKLVEKALQSVGLLDKKDLNIESLSAGEFQKANMALGLLSEADLFLLDEAVSNMDLINEIKIFSMLKKLLHKKEGGVTSVLIMHDINIAANFGEYFIGIKKGGKIIQAKKDDFFTKENLKEIYGIDFEITNLNGKIYVQPLE